MMEMLRMSWGAIAWAAHFGLLYGVTSIACARGLGGVVPWIAGGLTTAALGAVAAVVAIAFPDRARFESWMTAAIAGVAAIAIAFEGLAVVMVPTCR
jgi:hypothetical protein